METTVAIEPKEKTNHILHLLITLITGGIWVIVWICVAHSVSKHNANIGKPPAKSYSLYVIAGVVILLGLAFI